MSQETLTESPLGKETTYLSTYSPALLFSIPRSHARGELGLTADLPFSGIDIWNGYELSWLNLKGKPEAALAEFEISCHSPFIAESKSFKLYLNSFNQSRFSSKQEVKQILEKDLSAAFGCQVHVKMESPNIFAKHMMDQFTQHCLDGIDIEVEQYDLDPTLLKAGQIKVSEQLFTHLLKSNCLVTGQPDWGTLFIHYDGPQIDHEGLLKYIISFRNHQGFAEQVVERIFVDLLHFCKPEKLSVYARYTRRGGLDINPFRSNFESSPANLRVSRQ